MAPVLGAHGDDAALKRRMALAGSSGPLAVFQNLRVVGIAMFACLGGLLYGYNQGVFSGVLTMTAFGDHMGEYISNSTKKGWLTSILELGAWVGTLYSGFLAETLSRKHAILINTVVFIIGVVIQCTGVTASGANSILAGRFITGMGVGSLSMVVPMYNAECAPPEIRGLLVGLQQFSIEFGIMVSFWIDYGTNYIGGTGKGQSDAAWLVPLCLQLAPAILLFVGMIFMPYSPRWLVHHGREEEARKVIAQLRGDSNDEAVELEFLEIKAQSLFEKRSIAEKFPHLAEPTAMNTLKLQFVAIGSLFKTMPMFRRVIVATFTMFFQQWTGINAVLYYAPTIFGALGMSTNTTSLLATGVVGIVMFVTTIPMMLYVDKIGRKSVLISGAIAMGACHLIIAVIFAKNQHQWPTHQSAGWAAIVMVWLFAANFGWSWGPCAWIIVAEVWPLSARPYGIALGASANWMNNFIVGQVTPDMITGMAYGTFIFFGLITLLGSVFVWVFVPETKQLTLEEMDVIFGSQGVAAADKERIDQIHRELGLADLYAGDVHEDVHEDVKETVKEKETVE
ncbi:Quinate permease [Talaromyces islandicus]|uniref:Quinate permease n=1 Tax=Talaromyces islandicus TaxID=28573 RepID=A0A0U1LUJ1_TALIS|nr:Quinate permease [Talaromyces islandicus]